MYSIWLQPSGREFERYQGIIKQLSKQFKTPVFEPHITLLSDIPTLTDDNIYHLSILAGLSSVFEAALMDIRIEDSFYKSLYINLINNDFFHELNHEVRAIFPDVTYDFKPHLSLLYSKISEEDIKEIQIELSSSMERTLEIATLLIVDTNSKKVSNWKVIDTFPLHKKNDLYLKLITDVVSTTFVEKENDSILVMSYDALNE